MDHLINQTELADLLGVTSVDIVKFVKKGMPRQEGKTQKQTKYAVKDCVSWYIDYIQNEKKKNDDLRQAQIRKLNLESDRIELELSEKRNEIIKIEDVSKIWGLVLMEFKTKILGIPKKITALYDSISNVNDLEVILNDAVRESLETLSRAEGLQKTLLNVDMVDEQANEMANEMANEQVKE